MHTTDRVVGSEAVAEQQARRRRSRRHRRARGLLAGSLVMTLVVADVETVDAETFLRPRLQPLVEALDALEQLPSQLDGLALGTATVAEAPEREVVTSSTVEPVEWIDLDPVEPYAGPVDVESPRAVVTSRSFRMSDSESMQSTGNTLEVFDMAVGDLTGNGLDDIVALATGRRDSALYGGPGQPDFDLTERDLYVIVSRADGFGGFEPGRAYRMGFGWFHFYGLLRGGLALGDTTGDGRLDIVLTTGRVRPSISTPEVPRRVFTFLNDGDGTFSTRVHTEVTRVLDRDAHLVDLDGDGVLDLVALSNFDADDDGRAVVILSGNGDGTFTEAGWFPVRLGTSLVPIDLGGADGIGLVTTANPTVNLDGPTRLWNRTGDGLDSWISTPLLAPRGNDGVDAVVQATGVWAGDLDGDGHEDLVVLGQGPNGGRAACEVASANNNDGCVRVFMNQPVDPAEPDGQRQLVARPEVHPVRYQLWGNVYDALHRFSGGLVDLDGDGNLDVIVPGREGDIAVLHGDGEGGFEQVDVWNAIPNLTPIGGWSEAAEQNGYKQSIVSAAGVRLSTDPADPLGIVAATGPGDGGGGFHSSLALVEPVGDRRYRSAHSVPVVRQSNSTGWLGTTTRQRRLQAEQLVDWDGDGLEDLVLLAGTPDGPSLVRLPGIPGDFGPPERIGDVPSDCVRASARSSVFLVADLNGNGRLDVVCGTNRLAIVYGGADGDLEEPIDLGPVDVAALGNQGAINNAHATAVALVDVDGDGLPDLLYGGFTLVASRSFVGWSRQTPDGEGGTTFAPLEIVEDYGAGAWTWNTKQMAIADFTGNGLPDVALPQQDGRGQVEGWFALLRNETTEPGQPVFSPLGMEGLLTEEQSHLTAIDLGGPGPDIIATRWVFSNNNTNNEYLWTSTLLRNDGEGNFTEVPLPGVSAKPFPIAVDLDGDGILDLVTPSNWRGVEVRKQRADGTFDLPVALPIGDSGSRWVGVRDLDGNGRPDLVVRRLRIQNSPNHAYPELAVVMNTSTGLDAGAADLVLESLEVWVGDERVDGDDLTAIGPSEAAVVRSRIRNVGSASSGVPFTLGVWLSPDQTRDASDERLGEVGPLSPLGAGSVRTVVLPVQLVGLVAGSQFVIGEVDPRRSVADADRSNNIRTTEIEVDAPVLQVSNPTLEFVADPLTVTPSPGAPAVVRIPASVAEGGSEQAVRITVGAAGGQVSVMGRAGRMPRPPSFDVISAGNGSLQMDGTTSDRYLRVEGSGPVTLAAEALGVGLHSSTPFQVGTNAPVTLRLQGSGLGDLLADPTLLVQATSPWGSFITASAVRSDGAGGLFATFPFFTGPTIGSGSAGTFLHGLVVRTDTVEYRLSDAIAVVSFGEGVAALAELRRTKLAVDIFVPPETRFDRDYDAILTFTNTGLNDLAAPFIAVYANPEVEPDESAYRFSLDEPFFIPTDVPDAPAGVMPPGSSARVRIPFTAREDYEFEFALYHAEGLLPIPWHRIIEADPPPGLTRDEVLAVADGVRDRAGSTAISFLQAAHELRAEIRDATGVTIDDPGVLTRAMVDLEVLGLDGSVVSGSVRDGSGTARVDVLVEALVGTGGAPVVIGETMSAFDGRFAIRPTRSSADPAGTELQLMLGRRGPDPVATVTAPAAEVDLIVPDWTPVQGTVVSSAGAPAAAATVVVTDPTSGRSVSTVTDDDGSYSFAGISPGDHEIRAIGLNLLVTDPVGLPITGDESGPVDVDLTLLPGATVTGRAVDPDGAPVAQPSVVLDGDLQRREATGALDGRFTLADVGPGDVRILVDADGWAPAVVQSVVDDASSVDLGDVELVRAATVAGTVTDLASGAPIADAVVLAPGPLPADTVTDAAGQFVFEVAPDVTELFVTASGYADEVMPVELQPASDVQVDVALTVGAELRVDVTTDGSGPASDVEVSVVGTGAATTRRAVTTGLDGRAVITGLPVGEYLVSAGATGQLVTVVAPETSVELTAPAPRRVVGVLVDDDGVPAADAVVAVVVDGVTTVSRLLTDEDGGFDVPLRPGRDTELVVIDQRVGVQRLVAPGGASGEVLDLGVVGPTGSTLTLEMPWNTDPDLIVQIAPVGEQAVDVPVSAIADLEDPAAPIIIDHLADGEYRLTLLTAGFRSGTSVIVSGSTTFPVPEPVLGPLTGIAGPGALVSAWQIGSPLTVEAMADDTGAWDAGLVPTGTWQVAALVDGVLALDEVTVFEAGTGPTGFARSSRSGSPLLAATPQGTNTVFAGPDDPGSTSDPDAPLTAVGRVTSHLVDGVADGIPTSVYIRPSGSTKFIAAVETDADGWFRTPFLPDGSYEVVVRDPGHETAGPIQFTIPELVTDNGFRFGNRLGDIPRGDVIVDEPPTPNLSHLVDALLDTFRPDVADNDRDLSGLEQIRDFEPPDDCPPGAPGCGPDRSPTPGSGGCGSNSSPSPSPPALDGSDASGPSLADQYLAAAKEWAGRALEIHTDWGAQIPRIKDQWNALLLELSFRWTGVLLDVASLGIGRILKGAKASFDVVNKGRTWRDLSSAQRDMLAAYELAESVGTALSLLLPLGTTLASATVEAFTSGSSAPMVQGLDAIKLVVDETLVVLDAALGALADGGFARSLGEAIPLIGLGLSVVLNLYDTAMSIDETRTAVEAMEGELENYEFLFDRSEQRALELWRAYLSLADERSSDSLGGSPRELPPLPPGGFGSGCGGPRRSSDPNEITGPTGVGDERWVTPGRVHDYLVQFENLGPGSEFIPEGVPMADAPAAVVDIVVPLDPSFDLATFELGEFGFGVGDDEVTFEVPPGLQQFQVAFLEDEPRQLLSFETGETVDVTLEVRGSAWLDPGAREARWLIELVDPLTGLPHPDPDAGFLPPEPEEEELRGSGQGYGLFSVATRSDLSTGTDVTAFASIVFDDNDPIVTNTWSNRVDAAPPESAVDPLGPTTEIGSTISWSSTDDGSGTDRYDVWVRVGDGELELWVAGTEVTSMTFDAVAGIEYGFAVAGVDRAGQREPVPDQEQVTTLAVEPAGPTPDPGPGPSPGPSPSPSPGPGPSPSPGPGTPSELLPGFESLVPVRLLDSRPVGRVGAGSVTEVRVAGRGGVPRDASAVVLNVTVVDAGAPGYVTVFPCGGEPPEASNVNYVAGQTVPNAVVSKVGANGSVCVFTFAEVDLLVDVNGAFP